MADPDPGRRGGRTLRVAQLLLVAAGLGLWLASRMTWVVVRSADGLGQPKTVSLSGSAWSTAMLPLALLLLAAAVAALAVRGWPLRLVAVLVAVVSAATAYLAIAQWVVPDVAIRAADLAQVPVASLGGGSVTRQYAGAVFTLVAAVCTLAGAVLLMRSARADRAATARYAAPAARRSAVLSGEGSVASADGTMSERMIWDALDEGRDPTDRQPESDTGSV